MNKKSGTIIPHGVKPEPHELDTIIYFTELGKDVELIIPSNTPHAKTANFDHKPPRSQTGYKLTTDLQPTNPKQPDNRELTTS